MKQIHQLILVLFSMLSANVLWSQALRIPQTTNLTCSAGRELGVTKIEVKWNAPGVKGREGKIWGTSVAPYGMEVLGFGSEMLSPWRAGADECTQVSFSTDVTINGKSLPAGKYALFMILSPDSTTLIFNKNTREWGAYFYNDQLDVLRVTTRQQKNQPTLTERLEYRFDNQKDNSVDLSLNWEYWRIPFTIGVDVKATTLAYIQSEMSSELGFDPPSLEAAARWCLNNEVNFEQALGWITMATNPQLGGLQTFNALFTKAGLLEKLGKNTEAATARNEAMDKGSALELHMHGRNLLTQKKNQEAFEVFEKNYKRNNGAWPTNVGMMRGYSALGNYKKALEHAKLALPQAPDDLNKKTIEEAIKKLEAGKGI